MYMPVASPLSATAATSATRRSASVCGDGSMASEASAVTPISITFETVPKPGHWRSGIQASSRTTPTTTMTVPMLAPVARARPWCSTFHGLSPRSARTISAVERP